MASSMHQKNKNSAKKGKLKKTIKNIICRSDPLVWPVISEDQENVLVLELKKHRIEIPELKKPHWNELKLIPKEKRPKPPPLKKVNGLVFGRSECIESLQNGNCSAIILEAKVNPRIIYQTVLEACETNGVPVVCLNDLRKHSLLYFGIPTSSLGIKQNSLLEVITVISDIKKQNVSVITEKKADFEVKDLKSIEEIKGIEPSQKKTAFECPYLYRDSKNIRVFIPPSNNESAKITSNKFIGQDFIEFADKINEVPPNHTYKNMVLKRIANNPNRINSKIKKVKLKN